MRNNKKVGRTINMEMCNWCNLTAHEQKWKLTESSSWIVYLADKQDYICSFTIQNKSI